MPPSAAAAPRAGLRSQKTRQDSDDGQKGKRITEADEVAAEPVEGESIDEVNVAAVNIMNVAIENVAVKHPIGDIGKRAFVRRPPEAIVEVDDDCHGDRRVDNERDDLCGSPGMDAGVQASAA